MNEKYSKHNEHLLEIILRNYNEEVKYEKI